MNALRSASELVVHPLVREDIRALYPLMRDAMPALAARDWIDFARRMAARRDAKAGILVARWAGRRHACGSVCFRRQIDLRYGPVLDAEYLVAMDLLRPHAVRLALLDALETTAADLGCVAIRSVVDGGWAELANDLRRAGRASDSSTQTKAIHYRRLGRVPLS